MVSINLIFLYLLSSSDIITLALLTPPIVTPQVVTDVIVTLKISSHSTILSLTTAMVCNCDNTPAGTVTTVAVSPV